VVIPCSLQLREEIQGRARFEPSALGPIRARQYAALSAILIQEQRYDEGIEVARRAAVADPSQALAWNNLAAGYSSKRDWDGAILAAERAVQLAPQFTLAQNNLSWARAQKAKSASGGAAEQL
jgi:tetratricopeptide (TPR) repeat protein